MRKKVLIAYATRTGSTGEIAEIIGDVLTDAGWETDVLPVRQAGSIAEYDAVILGSAVRVGRLMPEIIRFAKKHSAKLVHCPVAAYSVSLSMKKDTPDQHIIAEQFLEPLRRTLTLVSDCDFAGKVDYALLGPVFGFLMKKMIKAPEGNFIDREAIVAWAGTLAETLQPNMTRETVVEMSAIDD
jgi:menaquinone-dependent protoporphyrinogen oxidase